MFRDHLLKKYKEQQRSYEKERNTLNILKLQSTAIKRGTQCVANFQGLGNIIVWANDKEVRYKLIALIPYSSKVYLISTTEDQNHLEKAKGNKKKELIQDEQGQQIKSKSIVPSLVVPALYEDIARVGYVLSLIGYTRSLD